MYSVIFDNSILVGSQLKRRKKMLEHPPRKYLLYFVHAPFQQFCSPFFYIKKEKDRCTILNRSGGEAYSVLSSVRRGWPVAEACRSLSGPHGIEVAIAGSPSKSIKRPYNTGPLGTQHLNSVLFGIPLALSQNSTER